MSKMSKAQRYSVTAVCALLMIAGFWSFAPAQTDPHQGHAAVSSATDWQKGYTLILLSNTDPDLSSQALAYVLSQGGQIAIFSPPHVMLGWLSPELSASLIGKHGIELITETPVDLQALKYTDDQTLATVSFFNSVASGSLAKESAASKPDTANPLTNDAREHPEIDNDAYLKNLEGLGLVPSPGNSDSMTGTVAVTLHFIESNGTIDPNLYTWTAAHQQEVINKCAAGLSWWSSRAPAHGASVTFQLYNYDHNHAYMQTGYEPIVHSSGQDSLWINQIMANMGFSSGDKFARVTAFNTWIRGYFGTNWSYSIFVGYNPSPAADQFTDGYSAYAYLGGPYVQTLYRNFNWNYTVIASHESGHIFWGCDEYYQAGYGGCTSCGVCSASGPRPTVLNGNCEYCNAGAVPCMMRANSDALCAWTPAQIGWPGVTKTCQGKCGGAGIGGCWCDPACSQYGDCCPDYSQYCQVTKTCQGKCGGQGVGGCWCDPACSQYGDCCPDYSQYCQVTKTCQGKCGGQGIGGCWCDPACKQYGDCCPDYEGRCGSFACSPPGVCGGYQACGGGCGLCFSLAEGGGVCVDDQACSGLTACTGSSGCPAGYICNVGTCCAGKPNVCVPLTCVAGAPVGVGGETTSGE